MVERSKSLLLMLAAMAALGTSACQAEEDGGGGAEADAGPGGNGGGGNPLPGGNGEGGNVIGGTPVPGGDEPPPGGNGDGGSTGGAVQGGDEPPPGGSGGGGAGGEEPPGGTIPIGDVCDPNDDQCVRDAICADIGLGKGPLCHATCDARGEPTGCEPTENCLEVEECADDAESCGGICIPTDNCSPCNAAETCGGPASCFANLAPASLCLTAGTQDVGAPCLNGEGDPTLPEVNCMEGLACVAGVCRAPCGGLMCGDGDNTCGEGEVCADFGFKLGGADFDICYAGCSLGAQTGCEENQFCTVVESAEVDGKVVLLNACFDGENGTKLHGEGCTPDDATYFGDCTAGNLCTDVYGGRDPICNGLCDAGDQSACGGPSGCLFGFFQLEGLGLCFGECDPFGAADQCGDGKKCEPLFYYGLNGGQERILGLCQDAISETVVNTAEDCTQDEETGATDCGPGHHCVALEQNAPPVCLPICDNAPESEHTCPAGFTCMTGTFLGTLGGERDSTQLGLCVPM
ncbi:hypothetical protein L6V77_09330 [Myxococcota bacterium]|nr:hypothetical protein [Myxococcota bacterium]